MARYEPDDGALTHEQIQQLKVLVATMNDLKFTTAGDYMHTRLEDLMYRSGLTASGCWDKMDDYDRKAIEKFAELIVKECAEWINDNVGLIDEEARADLLKHFEVKE